MDAQRDELDAEQRSAIHRHIHDLIEDFGSVPPSKSQLEADKTVAAHTPFPVSPPTCRVLCVPARAFRDELAGEMLVQLLRQQGFVAENASAVLSSGELVEMAAKSDPEAICVSVVAPSTLIHARYLSAKLRAQLPHVKIVVGIWGATENMAGAGERLRSSGADEVVLSLAEAVVQFAKFSVSIADEMIPGPIPDNDEKRLEELARLHLADGTREEVFDRITKKLARIFEVPIALITFIDRDHQWFKSQVGLPEEIAEAQQTSRELSVCDRKRRDTRGGRPFPRPKICKQPPIKRPRLALLRRRSAPQQQPSNWLALHPRYQTTPNERTRKTSAGSHGRRCNGGN
jgi:methylmalonyl-CoA mutase cobalamin-binding subunit